MSTLFKNEIHMYNTQQKNLAQCPIPFPISHFLCSPHTMAGSTSSISSNEGRSGGKSKPVAAAGRGYQLTTSNTTTSGTGSQSSSRAQSPTPPPPNVMQHTNTTLTNSPAASSRNALGITHGWGVGLAHSGSYLGKCEHIMLLLCSSVTENSDL